MKLPLLLWLICGVCEEGIINLATAQYWTLVDWGKFEMRCMKKLTLLHLITKLMNQMTPTTDFGACLSSHSKHLWDLMDFFSLVVINGLNGPIGQCFSVRFNFTSSWSLRYSPSIYLDELYRFPQVHFLDSCCNFMNSANSSGNPIPGPKKSSFAGSPSVRTGFTAASQM